MHNVQCTMVQIQSLVQLICMYIYHHATAARYCWHHHGWLSPNEYIHLVDPSLCSNDKGAWLCGQGLAKHLTLLWYSGSCSEL